MARLAPKRKKVCSRFAECLYFLRHMLLLSLSRARYAVRQMTLTPSASPSCSYQSSRLSPECL